MHILLVYQYYHNLDCPASGRHYQFIKSLSKHHQVTILTSDVWEKKRDQYTHDWVPEGVKIHSFPVPYNNSMSIPARLKAFAGFVWHAFRKGISIQKPDVILGTSTPLTAAWVAAVIGWLRGVPWVFEVRDLWPDFPIQMGAIRPQWLQRALLRLERMLYKSASHVITLSPDMEAHVLGKGISRTKVTTLLNGTDIDLAEETTYEGLVELKRKHQLQDKQVILYAGTFGRANAIPTLIETAKQLRHREDLQFVFIGGGYYASALQEASSRFRNITVLSPVARRDIFKWFRLARVSLVSFIDLPVLQANSPAKFFDSLSVGTPVIVTNNGWTRKFVEHHKCGWYVPPQNEQELAQCIHRVVENTALTREAGRNGFRVARTHFDRAEMIAPLEHILKHSVQPMPESNSTLPLKYDQIVSDGII